MLEAGASSYGEHPADILRDNVSAQSNVENPQGQLLCAHFCPNIVQLIRLQYSKAQFEGDAAAREAPSVYSQCHLPSGFGYCAMGASSACVSAVTQYQHLR